MTQPTDPENPRPSDQEAPAVDHPPTSGKEVSVALGLLYGGTVLLAILSLLFPALVSLQQAVLAGLLLFIPTWVLKRYAAPLTIDDLGVGMGPWGRTLVVSVATMAVVFSLFGVGFHVFQTQWNGARAVADPGRLLRWGEAVERAPSNVCDKRTGEDPKVHVWFERGGLWVMGPAQKRLSLNLEAGPEKPAALARALACPPGAPQPHTSQRLVAQDGAFQAPLGHGVWVPLPTQLGARVTLSLDGKTVPASGVRTGRFEQSASDPLEFERSLWWILTYIVVHLGLIALPEEWFFRGYLQPRLDRRFGTPVNVLGVRLGWGVVLSAAAFAILHPILIPGVYRLAVFFPALLFGWLRAKTGNIGAAVVVHACANLLQAILLRFYV